MTAQETTNYKRQLALLLRRQLALAKDSLMSMAQELVEAHFASIEKGNLLKSAQLKNLESVAFSSLSHNDVINFIRRQATKDRDQNENKPGRQKWIYNDLDQKLRKCVTELVGRAAGQTTGMTGHKDVVVANVKGKVGTEILETTVNSWFNAEREQEIQMELLREFVSYFTIFYALKKTESGAQEDDEERE